MGALNLKDFGAVGDGVTNDTDAFVALAAAINTADGGVAVYIPKANYLVGRQVFAEATGKGYAYKADPIFNVTNCTKPITLYSDGAKLIMAPGLKYGSFDPVTGNSHSPTLPFYNEDYAATLGYMLNFVNNESVIFYGNIELDGNCNNMIIGGLWGDKGRQITAYGVRFVGNKFTIVNGKIYTHHHCLDGSYIGQYAGFGGEEVRTVEAAGIISEYNCRQGLSLTGGNKFVISGSKFNYTGKAAFSTSLGAGVDIEAELGIVRDVLFTHCDFFNNSGPAMVADTGNIESVTFRYCRLSGYSNEAVWPKKPKITFEYCNINGALINAYGSTITPGNSTQFNYCTFTDEILKTNGPSSYRLIDTVAFPGVTFNNCTFISMSGRYSDFRNAILRNCTFIQRAGTETIQPNRFQALLLWGATVENLTIIDEIANPPADGYFVGMLNTTMLGENYVISNGAVKWKTWDAGAGGYTGVWVG